MPEEGEPQAVLLKAIVRRCELSTDGKYMLGAEFVADVEKDD